MQVAMSARFTSSRPMARARLTVARAPLAVRVHATSAVAQEAKPEATNGPKKAATQRNAATQQNQSARPAVILPPVETTSTGKSFNDSKALGRLLFLLRNHEKHMGFFQVNTGDMGTLYRAVRVTSLASRIYERENAGKSVLVNIASRNYKSAPKGGGYAGKSTPADAAVSDTKQAGSKAAGRAGDAGTEMRITAVVTDARPVVQLEGDAAKPFFVGNKTEPPKLAVAALDRLDKQGEVTLVAVGSVSVRIAIKAINIARVKARLSQKKDVQTYIQDVKVGDEPADASIFKATQFTLRFGELTGKSVESAAPKADSSTAGDKAASA